MAQNTKLTPASARQLTQPIDEYLLALADGVYRAQRQLSQLVIEAQPGQPTISYQLPRVDFELKVSFSLETKEAEGGRVSRQLSIAPADGTGATRTATASMVSTIKGAFVAVPATGGKPAPRLALSVKQTETTGYVGPPYTLEAHAYTASGEDLKGIEVQFNIDRDLSRLLSTSAGVKESAAKIHDGTTIDRGVVRTDAHGRAKVTITIGQGQPGGSCLAVQVNALGSEDVMVFTVPKRDT